MHFKLWKNDFLSSCLVWFLAATCDLNSLVEADFDVQLRSWAVLDDEVDEVFPDLAGSEASCGGAHELSWNLHALVELSRC